MTPPDNATLAEAAAALTAGRDAALAGNHFAAAEHFREAGRLARLAVPDSVQLLPLDGDPDA